MKRRKWLLFMGVLVLLVISSVAFNDLAWTRRKYRLRPKKDLEVYCRGKNSGLYYWHHGNNILRKVVFRCGRAPEGFRPFGKPSGYYDKLITLKRGEELLVVAGGSIEYDLSVYFDSPRVAHVYNW